MKLLGVFYEDVRKAKYVLDVKKEKLDTMYQCVKLRDFNKKTDIYQTLIHELDRDMYVWIHFFFSLSKNTLDIEHIYNVKFSILLR